MLLTIAVPVIRPLVAVRLLPRVNSGSELDGEKSCSELMSLPTPVVTMSKVMGMSPNWPDGGLQTRCAIICS
jgi:hypothetical protein